MTQFYIHTSVIDQLVAREHRGQPVGRELRAQPAQPRPAAPPRSILYEPTTLLDRLACPICGDVQPLHPTTWALQVTCERCFEEAEAHAESLGFAWGSPEFRDAATRWQLRNHYYARDGRRLP